MEEKRYRSDEVKNIIEERNKPTLKNFALDCYYYIYRCIVNIFDILHHINKIKWTYQRLRYGVSDRDTWGLYTHVASILVRGLKHIKRHQHGFPAEFAYNKEGKQFCSDEEAIISWNKVLDNMIYTFEICYRVNGPLEEDIWIHDGNEEDRIKLVTSAEKYNKAHKLKIRVLTKEEVEKFKYGFDLFKKHFFNLCD